MKSTDFKKIIKESVREAIREEFKEILLEALKNNSGKNEKLNESFNITNQYQQAPPQTQLSAEQRRNLYSQMLQETPLTTNNIQAPFIPNPSADSVNGSLPPGEVSIDQIAGLLKI
jgi:hypothetical protein